MQLLFHDKSCTAVYLSAEAELPQAIQALNLALPAPVLVLVGGAGGVEDGVAPRILGAVREIAKAVEAAGAAILDGGTQSGLMAFIGQARAQGNYKFPLVGVAVDNLVTWSGRPEMGGPVNMQSKRWPLDMHHSHFILVPGKRWGDESPWIASAATCISTGHRSVTVLINGGDIARQDLACSMAAGREVIVLRGSGRFADEVAGALERLGESKATRLHWLIKKGVVTIIDISTSLAGLDELIRQKLQKS